MKIGNANEGGLLDLSGVSIGSGQVKEEVGFEGRLSGMRQMRSLQSPPPDISRGKEG